MQEFKVVVFLNLWPCVAHVFRVTKGLKDTDFSFHHKLLERKFKIQEQLKGKMPFIIFPQQPGEDIPHSAWD